MSTMVASIVMAVSTTMAMPSVVATAMIVSAVRLERYDGASNEKAQTKKPSQ